MYEIEKNIPFAGNSLHRTLTIMEPGDSFLVPVSKGPGVRTAINKIYCDGKHDGWKFATRTIEGKLRIWRIQ